MRVVGYFEKILWTHEKDYGCYKKDGGELHGEYLTSVRGISEAVDVEERLCGDLSTSARNSERSAHLLRPASPCTPSQGLGEAEA